MFSQVSGDLWIRSRSYPQPCPQAAHTLGREAHSLSTACPQRRFAVRPRASRNCQTGPLKSGGRPVREGVEMSIAEPPVYEPVVRANAAPQHRGRAVRARRHAAVQGRDRRRHRGARAPTTSTARPTRSSTTSSSTSTAAASRPTRSPSSTSCRSAARSPGSAARLPAHAHRRRAHRRERRLLREDRRASRRSCAGSSRRAPASSPSATAAQGAGRRRARRPRPGRDLQGHRAPHLRGLPPARRDHARRPRRDRGDRQPRRPARSASPPASPTSTRSPTACTPAR